METSATPNWTRSLPNLPAASDFVPPGDGFPIKKIIALNVGKWIDAAGLQVAQTLRTIQFGYKQYRDGKFVLKASSDLGLTKIFEGADGWDDFDQFNDFFKPWTLLKRPAVAARWMEDAEFGRQRLVGINPTHIRRATGAMLEEFLRGGHLASATVPDGPTLKTVCARGELYQIDYRIFENLVDPDVQEELGRYPLAPSCLLHQNRAGQLVPVAIRLAYHGLSDASKPDTIFTPQGSVDDWLTAKIAVASADALYQGQITHLLHAHLVIEPFVVSTYRNLPKSHTLYQLLKPHFFNTLAINELARLRFLGRARFFDATTSIANIGSVELLTRAYSGVGSNNYQGASWQFHERALPVELASRDVGDLANYHYRDDALLHWSAIQDYVESVLKQTYAASGSLADDADVQRWYAELISPDLGGLQSVLPNGRATPEQKLSSVADLIAIVTNVIFTATAYHAAVNFGQRDYYTWIPNAQFAIYRPYDDMLNGKAPRKYRPLERLPGRAQSIRQMILSRSLSIGPPITSASLLTMKCMLQDEHARKAFDVYRRRLLEIERTIKGRNRRREVPYLYLLPSRVPQSIAI